MEDCLLELDNVEYTNFDGFIVLLKKVLVEKELFSFGGLVASGILLYQRIKAVRGDGKVY